MQRLEVSGAVRPIYGSLGVKRLTVTSKVNKFSRAVGTTATFQRPEGWTDEVAYKGPQNIRGHIKTYWVARPT